MAQTVIPVALWAPVGFALQQLFVIVDPRFRFVSFYLAWQYTLEAGVVFQKSGLQPRYYISKVIAWPAVACVWALYVGALLAFVSPSSLGGVSHLAAAAGYWVSYAIVTPIVNATYWHSTFDPVTSLFEGMMVAGILTVSREVEWRRVCSCEYSLTLSLSLSLSRPQTPYPDCHAHHLRLCLCYRGYER